MPQCIHLRSGEHGHGGAVQVDFRCREHVRHTLATHAATHTPAHSSTHATDIHHRPPVVEEDDILQGLEVAVVTIGLDCICRGLQIHIAQGRYFEFSQFRSRRPRWRNPGALAGKPPRP